MIEIRCTKCNKLDNFLNMHIYNPEAFNIPKDRPIITPETYTISGNGKILEMYGSFGTYIKTELICVSCDPSSCKKEHSSSLSY